ncbi:MAG: sigma-70 factor domain-containing protein, partial [Polyangiales bacterium]
MAEDEMEAPEETDEPQEVEVLGDALDRSEPSNDGLALSSSALSRRDPLGVYMRDVQRYPLLSKEEEHDLAVRYVEDDDLEAAKRLVTSN